MQVLMLVTCRQNRIHFDLESSALEDEILTLQNDVEIKASQTSAQPGEYVVFWKLLVEKYPNLRRRALNSFWINLFVRVYFLTHENHQVQEQINHDR